jgi:probable F420-dependent oxidoreductase
MIVKFGVMLLANPPVERLLELAERAESAGFDYFWLNDAPTHYEEPWPIFALVAKATKRIKIGPMVTNPSTRDWSCTAALLATLSEVSDGRMVCGIGRGDLAVSALGKPPASVEAFGRFASTIRELVAGRDVEHHSHDVRLNWTPGWNVELWGAAYGPRVLRVVGATCDGCIVQSGDASMVRWAAGFVGEGAREVGRDPSEVGLMVGAPAYVSDDIDHAHSQVRWFSGVVAEHMVELERRYGADVPEDFRGLASGRSPDRSVEGGLAHASAPNISNEVNSRYCLVGGIEDHRRRLDEFRSIGVTAYSAYLTHDASEEMIDIYGKEIIPYFRDTRK